MIDTGQLFTDADTVEYKMNFTPFLASKVKFISPPSGRHTSSRIGGRLEFMIKKYPDAATEADFN